MKTSYFTFGGSHIHRVSGFTYDCDIVVKITAENPREVMFEYFSNQWSIQYESEPDMSFFPRGIKELN